MKASAVIAATMCATASFAEAGSLLRSNAAAATQGTAELSMGGGDSLTQKAMDMYWWRRWRPEVSVSFFQSPLDPGLCLCPQVRPCLTFCK